MIMLKKISSSTYAVVLFLLLLGSSNSVFSANHEILNSFSRLSGEQVSTSLGEQVDEQQEFVVPAQKQQLFQNYCCTAGRDFEALTIIHTRGYRDYIKQSRYLKPSLGVKEVIFPFHVFL